MLTARPRLSSLFVAAFAPMLLATPLGPVDARRCRYWPPHRPVGSARRGRARHNTGGGLAVVNCRVEVTPHRVKLSGGRGLR